MTAVASKTASKDLQASSQSDDDFEIVTFGCRLNAYESEVMRGHAENAGLKASVIINTCAVTAEAERQARQAIRRAKRENPQAKVIVTGCAAQIDPNGYAAMPEVDQVLGNEEKLQPGIFAGATPSVAVDDIMEVRETALHLIDGFADKSRAFIQVQQGCDHRCTFCIIPYGRGNSRSVPLGALVEQVRHLARQGVPEVVLSGVDITSYGSDLSGEPSLGQMIRRLLAQVPELRRLRLSSLDVIELDPDLLKLIGEEERLMPHLHLSLQAGHDMTLKRMKRRHSRADAVALTQELRRLRPGIALGADLIAGFPTENEEMFQGSLDLIEDCGLSYLHIFPYSPRPGTPAARMPQLEKSVIRERAARLRAKGDQALESFLQKQIGQRAEVLIEKPGFGRCENFAEVKLEGGEAGEIRSCHLSAVEGKRLLAADHPVVQSQTLMA